MREIKIQIDGEEDRKTLTGILTDNGYTVKVKKMKNGFDTDCFVVIRGRHN